METRPRFDHLWHEALKQHGVMVKHSNGMRSALRLFRRAGYRFAKVILAIREHHHNQFLAQVISTGLDIDRWMDEHFEPLEQLGEDRRKIMAAIEDGMSERKYIEEGLLWVVKKRIAAPRSAAHVDVAIKAPSEELTDAERIKQLTEWQAAAKTEIVQLRRDLAATVREFDRVQGSLERMERILAATKRKAG